MTWLATWQRCRPGSSTCGARVSAGGGAESWEQHAQGSGGGCCSQSVSQSVNYAPTPPTPLTDSHPHSLHPYAVEDVLLGLIEAVAADVGEQPIAAAKSPGSSPHAAAAGQQQRNGGAHAVQLLPNGKLPPNGKQVAAQPAIKEEPVEREGGVDLPAANGCGLKAADGGGAGSSTSSEAEPVAANGMTGAQGEQQQQEAPERQPSSSLAGRKRSFGEVSQGSGGSLLPAGGFQAAGGSQAPPSSAIANGKLWRVDSMATSGGAVTVACASPLLLLPVQGIFAWSTPLHAGIH